MLVLEEVLVEFAMIAATVIAAAMLVYMVVGLVRERKGPSAAQRPAQARHHRHAA
jgi:hypothetical protein